MASTCHHKNLNRADSAFQPEDPFGDASEQLDGVELIDLTGVDEVKLEHPQQAVRRVNKSLRNYSLDGDHRSVKQVAVHGINYQVGQFVELREPAGAHKIQFIEIKSINAHNETDNVVIRGLPFARTRNLHGCLPRKWNEVCLILEVDVDDARPDEEQALLEIEPEQILRKRILTNTNQPFPDCRFDPFVYVTDEQKEHKAPLTCRWKMRAEYRDPSQRRAGRLQGQALEHLSERDSHKIKKRNLGIDQQRSRKWRGETIPGGSAIEAEPVKGEKEDSKPERIQKYSFAEVSAGAGGASRGAQLAGLKVVLATEPCPHACDSYRANFPNTELYQMATKELTADESQYAADFLHISSSALSAAGDDEEAVKEICTDLLEKFHPRVLTMEQPATITSEQKAPFINAILRSFTEAGYSIQWKPVHMVTYGLPQVRKRFIMIGAGPGEKLPSWPAPTHSLDPTGDQQRFITEEEAISGLNPRLHSLHNPDSMRVINRAARDADRPIDSAISASGSAYPHPDGEREFTLRELACLQGFPTYHDFKGSYLKKQISTALPPSVAMAFYQHLRQHLEEVDGVHSSSPEPFELSGTSSTSNFPETGNPNEAGSPQPGEAPSAPPDEAMPDAMETIRSNEHPVRSTSRQRIEPAAMPFSPRLTMSPEAQQNAGSASHTPSPAQQLPTPAASGQSIAGQRAAALRRRRERAVFEEEPESDGDNDDGGPETLQTPSKRPRISPGRRERTHSSSREGSRTGSSLSDDARGPVEDVLMPEDDGDYGEV